MSGEQNVLVSMANGVSLEDAAKRHGVMLARAGAYVSQHRETLEWLRGIRKDTTKWEWYKNLGF